MRIGIIGIGAMGWGVAQALMRGPHDVYVHDCRDEANEIAEFGGAVACATPAALAASAELIITLVVDGAQTEAALFGPGGAHETLCAGQIVMLSSTMAVDEVIRIAARLRERGIVVLDAPLSGGPDRARDGTLTIATACDAAALAAVRPAFDYMARDVFHLSETMGDGARVKLVESMLAGINLVAAAEALALGAKLGLDLPMLFDVLRHSAGQSWIGEDRFRRLLAGDRLRRASPEILAKDLRLATSLAAGTGFDAVLARQAQQIFADAGARWGERDDAEVVRWYDERAGTGVADRLT